MQQMSSRPTTCRRRWIYQRVSFVACRLRVPNDKWYNISDRAQQTCVIIRYATWQSFGDTSKPSFNVNSNSSSSMTPSPTIKHSCIYSKKLIYCWRSSRYDNDSGRSANPTRNREYDLCKVHFTNRACQYMREILYPVMLCQLTR